MEVEEQLIAEGVAPIWVLQEDTSFNAGTAEACTQVFHGQYGSNQGWCVGDGESEPNARIFDRSDLAQGRGFDILVRRSDMRIIFATSHGTPRGNENLTGDELLAEIRRLKAN